MFDNDYFYYKLLRKYVILFGNMFNNITIIRKTTDTEVEIQRIKVPISYAPKDKYVTRLSSDPDLIKATQVTLPRMAFEIVGIEYDPARRQNALLRNAKGENSTTVSTQFMGVPYSISFVLNIYSRNIDDANHIVEQILPYFGPDYTVTIDPISQLGFMKDIPVILNSVNQSTQYEGNWDSVRYVNWEMKFTLKGYFYGPITTPKLIRKSIANIFNDPSLVAGYTIKMNLESGNGTFKINDVVYQGVNYNKANAYGIVMGWHPDNGKLLVSGAQGQFKANSTIRSSSSNAAYIINSFDASPIKLAQITVEPDPIDAAPDDDFGYSVSLIEWPDTEPGANN